MSDKFKTSVVIVSRDRAEDLRRLLLSLRFQTFKDFEVIVVSNLTAEDYCPKEISTTDFHHIDFAQANISAARNKGIDASSGKIIAFIDDDAIPEPLWLKHLITAFENPKVAVSGGFVRGRNGISFQWQGIEFDELGDDYPIEIIEPFTRGLSEGRVLKAQGTNIAFRKSALVEIGGFEESFEFYLDETDVCLRLAKAGFLTTIIPLAEVTHGYSESRQRRANRTPKTLKSLGRSKFLFLRKHGEVIEVNRYLKEFEKDQRMRLLRMMEGGQLEPRDISRLLETLQIGIAEAKTIISNPYEFSKEGISFTQFSKVRTRPQVLYSSFWKKTRLQQEAAQLAKNGETVQCYCMSRTSVFHKRLFTSEGFWLQTGGIFGRSERSQPIFQFPKGRLSGRVLNETTSLLGRFCEIAVETKKIT